jgi:hypothetical protein
MSSPEKTGYEFKLVGFDELSKGDLPLILVQSGGSEGFFKRISIRPTKARIIF